MEIFSKIVLRLISQKNSILDVWMGLKYASELWFLKKYLVPVYSQMDNIELYLNIALT